MPKIIYKQMQERKTDRIPLTNILLIVAFTFFSICGYGRNTNIAAATTMLAIFMVVIKKVSPILYLDDWGKSYICFVLYFVYLVATSFFNMSSPYYFWGTTVLWNLVQFFPLMIFAYIRKNESYERLNSLFILLSFVWFTIILASIVTFSAADKGGRSYAQLSRGFLIGGGYPMAYGSALLSILVFSYLIEMHEKSTLVYIFLLISFIISIIHVIYTESVITIAAMCVGLGLVIVFRGEKNISRTILRVAIIVAVVIFILIAIKPTGLLLIKIGGKIDNAIFSQRITEIGQLIYYDTESHHVGARMYTILASLETFLQHPIWGVGYYVGNEYEFLATVGVGNHSELLDALAQYGIVGGLPFIGIYFFQLRALIGGAKVNLGIPISVTLLILTGFNPFTSAQTGFMLFLYMPMLVLLLNLNDNA